MKKPVIAAVALVAVLALAGCATNTHTGTSNAGSNKTPSSTPAEQKSGNLAFGDTATYKNGVSITVSAPQAFTPGQYSSGADQKENVIFTVTVKNGSKANYKPDLINAQVSSAGTEGEGIFDSDNALNGTPQTVVLPGQTVTFKDGWSIADATKITYEITPDVVNADSAIFTNVG